MKVSQIAFGRSYEDKKAETVRKVVSIHSVGRKMVVEYTEKSPYDRGPLYLPLRLATRDLPLAEFAAWAARPAGTKKLSSEKKFTDWLRGPTDLLARHK